MGFCILGILDFGILDFGSVVGCGLWVVGWVVGCGLGCGLWVVAFYGVARPSVGRRDILHFCSKTCHQSSSLHPWPFWHSSKAGRLLSSRDRREPEEPVIETSVATSAVDLPRGAGHRDLRRDLCRELRRGAGHREPEEPVIATSVATSAVDLHRGAGHRDLRRDLCRDLRRGAGHREPEEPVIATPRTRLSRPLPWTSVATPKSRSSRPPS